MSLGGGGGGLHIILKSWIRFQPKIKNHIKIIDLSYYIKYVIQVSKSTTILDRKGDNVIAVYSPLDIPLLHESSKTMQLYLILLVESCWIVLVITIEQIMRSIKTDEALYNCP